MRPAMSNVEPLGTGIEQGLLDDDDVWPLRQLALPDGAFGLGDFF
jgi:hypothetical protein